MKTFSLILTIALGTFLCSCSKTKDVSDAHINEDTLVSSQSQDSIITENTQPVNNASQTPMVSPPAVQQSAVANANPPHGQPGHRCDIPVGASLDTPPSKNNIQAQTAPVIQNTKMPEPKKTVQESPSATASGKINPPHGQPNHRCDVPVGQPLP